MEFIAHVRDIDSSIQTVKEHLLGVQNLAEKYGEPLHIKHITGLAGLLHDLGKYTNEFNQYIQEAVRNPDLAPKRGSVDHSSAGGKLLFDLFHSPNDPYKSLLAEIVGNSIISHHSYLNDFLNESLESPYLKRVKEKQLDEFEFAVTNFFTCVMPEKELRQYVQRASSELEEYLAPRMNHFEMEVMFLTKYIFSALIDADRTDTRMFEDNKKEKSIKTQLIFKSYYEKLLGKLHSFKDNPDTIINRLRMEMSQQCDDFSIKPDGIYTLSIPTGGGKTLASLRYALRHAVKYDKKRIIYIVPFTTIIEQNAQEVRNILNDTANILEHHSNIWEDNQEHEDESILAIRKKLSLAKDNWDSPIIFTTLVQFLNVFYDRSSRNIRRLHNLSDSIIVFDEVQKVPVKCVSLFNEALNFLKNSCHCSLVLCTATQPALEYVEHQLQINTDGEIIKNIETVTEAFKRVHIVDKTDKELDLSELVVFIHDRWKSVKNILIILNTKLAVRKLYQELKKVDLTYNLYHLSTSMCPAHRIDILKKVKEHLHNNERVVCISTQLIEAGVDISFECVIRSLAGLDSIAQAAGRCNRHGEANIRNVYVINYKEENLSKLREIKKGKEITQRLLIDLRNDTKNHGGTILSNQAIKRYFNEFYSAFKGELDYPISKIGKTMIQLLSENSIDSSYSKAYRLRNGTSIPLYLTNSYKLAAENFRVIEENTSSIVVPYTDEGKELINDLNGSGYIEDVSRLLKKAQHYSVNVYDNELQALKSNRAIEYCFNNSIIVLKDTGYSSEFGINIDNDELLKFLSY